MHFSGQSNLQTQSAVFYINSNHFASAERPHGTRYRSRTQDAIVRERIATCAAKSASFNAAERGDPPKCHPDTRIAVQNSLVAWRSNRAAGPVRLISGWAGTGKTTIAQTMAEYWAEQRQLGGSFFFSRSSEKRNETSRVCETILHQFLQLFGMDMDVGYLDTPILWAELVRVLASTPPTRSLPIVIVIDGLDECDSLSDQVHFLRRIFNALDLLGSSVKILISCRPEPHLQDVFHEFARKLGSSYRIQLGQSAEDNDDIRTFLRVSFNRIYQQRRRHGAMSITHGLWPSQEEIEWLVGWASGQFVFAATLIRFVDDENEDPVEMLNLVLEQRASSFEAIDLLYIVILKRVGRTLDKNDKSLELRQMMQNLILHVNSEPSSSLTIADFWFGKEVAINILVQHLQALLVRSTDAHGEVSQSLIQFRHKSFHDFFARPSTPHSFSLSEMNPVSKFFFSLRKRAKNATDRSGGWALQPSQWLGYVFFCCGDHPPTVFPYEEEARRLHRAYVRDRPTFRGCKCLPRLKPKAIGKFKSCGQRDCVINLDLVILCRMMEVPVDHFKRIWNKRWRLRTLFPVLKLLLWLRLIVYGLLSNPSAALYGTTRALMHRPSSLRWQARCIAIFNGLLCVLVFLNTRSDVVLFLHVSHYVATFLLVRFLRFDAQQMEPRDNSVM
ncbi:hypothetical protein BDN72DRAFT_904075 [Pluteus cervinus]|uniref:Uncharacterized protein n=1 Tax=Pluteus cervinus TaxID=181527 RepID=A0ACD3A708_9AGAR|nr:hypothetical protein BDN72DRAFT_904075 [Pluteus cervinus]